MVSCETVKDSNPHLLTSSSTEHRPVLLQPLYCLCSIWETRSKAKQRTDKQSPGVNFCLSMTFLQSGHHSHCTFIPPSKHCCIRTRNPLHPRQATEGEKGRLLLLFLTAVSSNALTSQFKRKTCQIHRYTSAVCQHRGCSTFSPAACPQTAQHRGKLHGC